MDRSENQYLLIIDEFPPLILPQTYDKSNLPDGYAVGRTRAWYLKQSELYPQTRFKIFTRLTFIVPPRVPFAKDEIPLSRIDRSRKLPRWDF